MPALHSGVSRDPALHCGHGLPALAPASDGELSAFTQLAQCCHIADAKSLLKRSRNGLENESKLCPVPTGHRQEEKEWFGATRVPGSSTFS